MASIAIHVAVGKEYCKRNNIEDTEEFIEGCIAPDVAEDRVASHYGKQRIAKTYTEAILNKVDLLKFCKQNKIDSVYNRGIFLHLLTDYIFYKEYLLNLPSFKDLENKTYQDIKNIVYLDYNILNKWIFRKFNIAETDIPEISNGINDGPLQVLTTAGVYNVIKECAQLDLDAVYQDILNKNSRWI